LGAVAGFGELFAGEGDAKHVGTIIAGERDGGGAPTTADIEHGATGLVEQELCRDVTDFGLLGGFDGFVTLGKIGAGIKTLAIEEQGVESAIQIIMMGDVAAGAACVVDL
jgi:hypothetical protein